MKKKQKLLYKIEAIQQPASAEKEVIQVFSGRAQARHEIEGHAARRRRVSYAGAGDYEERRRTNTAAIKQQREEPKRQQICTSGQQMQDKWNHEAQGVPNAGGGLGSNKTSNRAANKFFATSPIIKPDVVFHGQQQVTSPTNSKQSIMKSKNRKSTTTTSNMGWNAKASQQRNHDYNQSASYVGAGLVAAGHNAAAADLRNQMLPSGQQMLSESGGVDAVKQYFNHRVICD